MKTFFSSKLIPWILGASLLGTSLPAIAADSGSGGADDWRFAAEAYLWAPWIDVTTETGSDVEITLEDILNNLDMLFMGALSAGKGKWSVVMDVIYFDIESNKNRGVLPGLELKNINLSAWVVTPQVRYSVLQTSNYRFGLLAGARYLEIEADHKLDTVAPLPPGSRKGTDSGSKWDGIVGLTGQMDLSDQWYVSGYLDLGTGQSDYTWQALASVGYRFEKVDFVVGYRYLDYDLGSDEALSDLTIHGPIVGVKFPF